MWPCSGDTHCNMVSGTTHCSDGPVALPSNVVVRAQEGVEGTLKKMVLGRKLEAKGAWLPVRGKHGEPEPCDCNVVLLRKDTIAANVSVFRHMGVVVGRRSRSYCMVSIRQGPEGRGDGLLDLNPRMAEGNTRVFWRVHPQSLTGAGLSSLLSTSSKSLSSQVTVMWE